MPKYDNITVRPADGNAFSVMGATLQAMRRAKVPLEEQERYKHEATQGKYDHLLQVTMRWVNLEPTNGFDLPDEEEE